MTVALNRQQDWQRRGATLSALFTLDRVVPPAVVVNMALNPNHGVNLWIALQSDGFDGLLLKLSQPPDLGGRDEDDLLQQADEALEDLAAIIEMTVSNAILAKREATCLSCPNLKGSPSQLKALFAVIDQPAAPGRRLEDLVCGACGCQLGRKLRWSTQNCPQPDPAAPMLSRWGEPR